ncbi:formate dehydrogenase accessory protein FdhE [Anaerobacillus alkaliphilus]|uniref:Formate dehydrogenase accessory protein FdhE n=1 Tax=Anaerobacillus alkaliphilus TaxID=1548597 RepID=A0A4Q0VRR2_9BACI|nr:formate dehydrogenase accessory protein FdhE [Anaerobacillus alkaliphilus]RXI98675.1 formate dehydrogenase accessory protein FdhE [Anaerobacillus alkaliphilus]
MKQTVISPEYLDLQTAISNKQLEWEKQLDKDMVVTKQSLHHKEVPVIAQTSLNIDFDQYQQWIIQLASFLVEKDDKLTNCVELLKEKLDCELVKIWSEEVLSFNQLYFQAFAEKEGLPEWLPYFLAEHSIRPYLRMVSSAYSSELPNLRTSGSCPCCGEPIRVAVLEGKGIKMIVCPRCEAKWNQKRIHCSFCGNEDHKLISYYNIENDNSSRIEVCDKCNGYSKIIDTRKLLKKQSAFLLDLTSIHLDFVAQENGFGVTKDEDKVKS